MGSFDWVDCRVPLPDGFSASDFQTKSLSCEGKRYTIHPNGLLTVAQIEYEFVDGDDSSSNLLDRLGTMHEVAREEVRSDYYGTIYFSTLATLDFFDEVENVYGQKFQRPAKRWHEYEARFADGKLVAVRQMPPNRYIRRDDDPEEPGPWIPFGGQVSCPHCGGHL